MSGCQSFMVFAAMQNVCISVCKIHPIKENIIMMGL